MKRRSIVILFLTFLFILCGCGGTFSVHKVKNKEPLQTEVFLGRPEKMIRISEGKEEELSSETASLTYDRFLDLMDSLESTDTFKQPFDSRSVEEWKKENVCVEFRYDQRRNYIGNLSRMTESDHFTWGQLTFDAMLIVCYGSDSLIAVPYLDDAYIGVNGLFLVLHFPQDKTNDFTNLVAERA